jgi:hypothetical protein
MSPGAETVIPGIRFKEIKVIIKVTYLAAWYRFLPWIRNFCLVIVGLSVMPAFITGNLSLFTGWVKLVIMLAVLVTGITLIVQCEVETKRKSTENLSSSESNADR